MHKTRTRINIVTLFFDLQKEKFFSDQAIYYKTM